MSVASAKAKGTDLTSWLFISIDTNGKVLINSISKTMKIYMASKHTLCEQKKGELKYQQLSCRFSSALHPQQKLNDLVTLVAIGNYTKVHVYAITPSKTQHVKEINVPGFKPDSQSNEIKKLPNCLPSITWGYGHSPFFKEKCYATLAVAWGPLIQLYILNDILETTVAFVADGFLVLQPDPISFDGDSSSLQNKSKDSSDKSSQLASQSQLEEINPYEQNQRFEAVQQLQDAKAKTG